VTRKTTEMPLFIYQGSQFLFFVFVVVRPTGVVNKNQKQLKIAFLVFGF
jgi:hypothetical protein